MKCRTVSDVKTTSMGNMSSTDNVCLRIVQETSSGGSHASTPDYMTSCAYWHSLTRFVDAKMDMHEGSQVQTLHVDQDNRYTYNLPAAIDVSHKPNYAQETPSETWNEQ